jgi:sterol desaturase/sphingolipid hydroxylase (fatty acid hydroxylase superfamily)
MTSVAEILAVTARSASEWLVIFAVLTLIELRFARGEQPLAARIRGLAFWAAWIPVTAITVTLIGSASRSAGIQPLIQTDLGWMGWAGLMAAPLVGAFVYDFFFYWCHRAQHRWLWRFHAVHHSIRNLSAVNSYHHVTEAAVQTLLIVVPMGLLIAEPTPGLGILYILLRLQPVFLHSPTRLHLGPLRAVFADNRFHRIHHSLEERHFDRNFGAFTTFWDRLFGTAHFPAPDEWPDTGLADVDEPQSIREWLDLPWRYPTAPRHNPPSGETAVA